MAKLDIGDDWEDYTSNPDLIQMGHNLNFLLDLNPGVKQAMIDSIEAEEFRNYPPPMGYNRLREFVINDMECPGAKAMMCQGGTDAIYQVLSVTVRPGDEVIVSDPGWPHIPVILDWLGAKAVEVPIYSENCAYKLLPDLVRDHLSERTRMIAFVDPLNPLGSAYGEDEVEALCEIAEERGLYVFQDATYRDFSAVGNCPAVRCYDRAVTTMSLSKGFAFAGLRLGAVVAQPELFAALEEQHVSRFGVNQTVQRGAIAGYESKSKWLPGLLEANRRNQALVETCVEALDGLHVLVSPSNGNFLAVDVTNSGCGPEAIVDALLDENIVIRSGAYTTTRYKDRFIRITTTVPTAQIERFCEVFPRVVKKLAK